MTTNNFCEQGDVPFVQNELIVSYDVNTYEIVSSTKSYGGIKEVVATILSVIIFVIIVAISLFIITKIGDIKIDRQYSQYKS